MRLATIETDFWELRSAEESHRLNPETFHIPPREARESLRRGQAAKLIFDIETEEAGQLVVGGERMWVIVAEQHGDTYIGVLDSQPATVEPADNVYLCFGAEVPFRAEHVVEIGDPPSEYVEWQLGQAPERRWSRDSS